MDHGSENTFIRYMEDMKKPAPIVDFESGIFSGEFAIYVNKENRETESGIKENYFSFNLEYRVCDMTVDWCHGW